MAAVEEMCIQSFQMLHSCIGQASTQSLRPCLSQSAEWLLIYCQRTCKISVSFKISTAIVLEQCKNKVSFQRKGTGIVLKIFAKSFASFASFNNAMHFTSIKFFASGQQ